MEEFINKIREALNRHQWNCRVEHRSDGFYVISKSAPVGTPDEAEKLPDVVYEEGIKWLDSNCNDKATDHWAFYFACKKNFSEEMTDEEKYRRYMILLESIGSRLDEIESTLGVDKESEEVTDVSPVEYSAQVMQKLNSFICFSAMQESTQVSDILETFKNEQCSQGEPPVNSPYRGCWNDRVELNKDTKSAKLEACKDWNYFKYNWTNFYSKIGLLAKTVNKLGYHVHTDIPNLAQISSGLDILGLNNPEISKFALNFDGWSTPGSRKATNHPEWDRQGLGLLKHSIAVGWYAKEIAKLVNPELADKAALAGLLHDVGKPTFESSLETLGKDHGDHSIEVCNAAGLKLDPEVQSAIRNHMKGFQKKECLLDVLINIADYVVSRTWCK